MPHYLAFVPVAQTDEGEALYAKRDLGDRGRIESAVDAAFDNPFVEKAELVKKNELAVFGVTREIKRLGDDGEAAPKRTRRKKAEEEQAEVPPVEPDENPEEPPADDADGATDATESDETPVRGFVRDSEE